MYVGEWSTDGTWELVGTSLILVFPVCKWRLKIAICKNNIVVTFRKASRIIPGIQ